MALIYLVCPMRNVAKYIEKCLTSIVEQTFVDWHLVLIDDDSTDGTPDVIREFVDKYSLYDKTHLVVNKTRMCALWNINEAIKNHVPGDPVIGIIDGDDWLYTSGALQTIFDAYRDGYDLIWSQNIRWPSMQRGASRPAKKRNPRNKRRGISAFRTFRRSLFLKIPESEFLGPDNKFIKYPYDKAIIYPISELSNKMKFLDEILYVYNQGNPSNDDKVNLEEQIAMCDYLESKPRLTIL